MASGAAVAKVGSIAGAIASASYVLARNPASADKTLDPGSFFSGSSSAAPAPAAPAPLKEQEKPRNDAPRTSAVGFDPEALERGAKALREINASNHAKKVIAIRGLIPYLWFFPFLGVEL
jgi:ATPase family AAA domain-containing protein 3A/B